MPPSLVWDSRRALRANRGDRVVLHDDARGDLKQHLGVPALIVILDVPKPGRRAVQPGVHEHSSLPNLKEKTGQRVARAGRFAEWRSPFSPACVRR